MLKYIEFSKDISVNFTLNACLLVNVKDKTVFEINAENLTVFKMLYKGESLDNCDITEDTILVKQIINNHLGKLVETRPFNESYALGSSYYDVEGLIPINAVYVELPFMCNKNCDSCQSVAAFSCERCHKPISDTFKYNINMLKTIKCNTITFVSGSIVEYISEFKQFFLKIRNINEDVQYELICFGDILGNIELIEFCNQYSIKLIVSIDVMDINEELLLNLNLWNKELIQINYVLNMEEYMSVFHDVKLSDIPYTYTIVNIKSRLDFSKFNYTLDSFYINAIKKYNLCLFSKIYIRSDGTIIPCSGIYDIELGKVRTERINFNQNAMRKIWEGSPVNIKGCQNCAYNIICKECRALDYLIDNKLEEKTSCSYIGGN